MEIVYCAIASIILAAVDAFRIWMAKGTEANINHKLSSFFAILLAVPAFVLSEPIHFAIEKFLLSLGLFSLGYVSIRILIYAPTLNLLRGKHFDYESATTSSWVDSKFHFWQQRVIGLVGVIIFILIKVGVPLLIKYVL